MTEGNLHRPLYVPDLLVNALNQTPKRPLLQLADGPTLTVGQVRDATSQFVQALRAQGVGQGSRVATLSSNRPEVLHVAHAVQIIGAIAVPMHPMAGLADHQHVIQDAQVDVLVFDAERFEGRASELAGQARGMK
ncbi:MAG: AMP-binding protein, partial [Myxococcales bacterium]|nr:AMP-binding protein [Myxococcales bacterium]